MKTSRLILMLLVATATISGCDKLELITIAEPQSGGANVKFFNFSVGSKLVNFYVNDTKATAVSATGCAVLDDSNRDVCTSTGLESNSGIAYGGAGAGGWYSNLSPGQVTIAAKIAEATDKSLGIASAQTTIAEGKFYSYYLSGVYNTTTKSTDSFILEDVMPPAGDFTTAYVRFVNASSSTTGPMTLWLKERTTRDSLAIGGAVAYKSGGAFVTVPARRPLPDSAGITGRFANTSWDLAARYADSPTAIFTRAQLTFVGGRVYTITARGTVGTSSTMLLDNTANR